MLVCFFYTSTAERTIMSELKVDYISTRISFQVKAVGRSAVEVGRWIKLEIITHVDQTSIAVVKKKIR